MNAADDGSSAYTHHSQKLTVTYRGNFHWIHRHLFIYTNYVRWNILYSIFYAQIESNELNK